MASELIATALKTADETKAIAFGDDVLGETGKIFAEQFPGVRVLVVADENTFAAAGEPVVASLKEAGVEFAEDPYLFPGKPTVYAGYENVEILRDHLKELENTSICSIGGGTINDLAKLASGELGRQYMNVCSAASVDGYAAFGASIARDGFKITRDCPAPQALVADNAVMAAAPARLTYTGYGDLIEKIPAGADWMLADELGIEPIDDYVWSLVQGPLRESLAHPVELAAGQPPPDRRSLGITHHVRSRPAARRPRAWCVTTHHRKTPETKRADKAGPFQLLLMFVIKPSAARSATPRC